MLGLRIASFALFPAVYREERPTGHFEVGLVPELPDITAYVRALEARILNRRLENVRVAGVSLLRTADPAPSELLGRRVRSLRRIGKRIAIGFEGDLWIVLHLMIAGRLHWRPAGTKLAGRRDVAAFDFEDGTLTLTEAGTKRRASMHVVRGSAALDEMNPGGIDVFDATFEEFRAALSRENRTLKRALTDPRIVDGIGNAYSDEILHAALLSPIAMTSKLDEAAWRRLFDATRSTLRSWIDRFANEAADGFPERVTAFRPDMAVHGRFGKPCPRCGTPIQRIRYADNETNYCPQCQTGGTLLADRSLSRLLKRDWPRTLADLEELKRANPAPRRRF